MKEITGYFTSPTKKKDERAELKVEVGIKKNGPLPSGSPNTSPSVENKQEANNATRSRKKRKKSNRYQSPDPAVNNISELFSNNLKLKSPNKADKILQDTAVSDVVVTNDTSQSSNQLDEDNEKVNTTQTPNAFQLLMDSRHKIIGSNSPGKEIENSILNEDPDKKETLSTRKKLLAEWSEKKGVSKRKRLEEELDEVINYKLEKRAKRMKTLLQHENNDRKDIKKRKKRLRRLSSSSDSIISIVSHGSECEKNDLTSSDLALKNDLNEQSNQKIENSESRSEISPTKGKDTLHNSCKTDSNNRKSNLLHYFGSTNKIDTNSNEKNLELVENTPPKRKRGRPRKTLISTEVDGGNTVERMNSPPKRRVQNKKNIAKSTNSKISPDKENVLNSENSNESNEDILVNPRKLRSWKLKIKLSMDQHKNEMYQNSDELSDHQDADSESDQDVVVINSSQEGKSESKNNYKLAPMFVKSTPKPKEDPEVLEARKRFLMSEMPSNIKRPLKKQHSFEDKEFIFPEISHVQQKCDSIFWNMTRPNINVQEMSPMKLHDSTLTCKRITKSKESIFTLDLLQHKHEKIVDATIILDKIKTENPDYPVFKSYRFISEKCQTRMKSNSKNKKKSPKKGRKGKRKSLDKSVEIIEPQKVESIDHQSSENAMWTEKYKPKFSEEIIGNTEAVKALKAWLEMWKNFSKEINLHKRRKADDSATEFETTDYDDTDDSSRDSSKFFSYGNTMVLSGPCGSGKSSAVYAICNELAFNVIEINASSKRTGKRLIQKLQEATQSHQVRKHNNINFNMQSLSRRKCDIVEETTSSDKDKRKMCVLFVEDIDIIFEQDDGFISALIQLIATSKRPIIISTTDYNSVFVQKSLGQYKHIQFHPLSSYSLATWLQILCLVEGMLVNRSDIGNLLEYNRGDVRKTILQLQFWVQSGGQIAKDDDVPVTVIEHVIKKHEEQFLLDDDEQTKVSPTKDTKPTDNNRFEHRNCIRSFEIFENYKTTLLPYYVDLGLLWWNISNILDIPSLTIDKNAEKINSTSTKCDRTTKYSKEEQKQLKSLTDIYSSMCLTDCYFRKVNYFDSTEPHTRTSNNVQHYCNNIEKDSVAMNERMDLYNVEMDMVHEVTYNLIDGYAREYGNENPRLDLTLPSKAEKRWRAKQYNCINKFQEVLPTSACLDRKSVALDYLPCLRSISRSENQREINNTKRGNRFRNYLNSLGLRGSENLQLANDILI